MEKGKANVLEGGDGRGAGLLGIGAREHGAEHKASTAVTALDRWVADRVLAAAGRPPVEIELWTGEVIVSGSPPVSRVVFKDRPALFGLLYRPDLHFGDAFSAGRIKVQGELVETLEALYRSIRKAIPPSSVRRRVSRWVNRPSPNSRDTAHGNIHHHYDLGNDFYRLWLDERMVYTCAYYPSPSTSLEEAQVAKMEHVCRKLQLRPGLRVVEAGCGWGALALYMAARYDVRVIAYNISTEQIGYARDRARREGLADRVEFVEDDYRSIDDRYDRFVSVGMLEHVGVHNYRELGALVRRSLAPDGLGLIHTIGRNAPAPNNPWIERRIFPGSCPPSLAEMTAIFEPERLSILDVENLRLHYGRTCREWLVRFERAADTVGKMYDSSFVRAWRLYLAGSVAAFTTGGLQLFQVLFSHEENNAVPLTREHLYR
jgi:cyclopropane-fatty-acyl-phospholipid synthase